MQKAKPSIAITSCDLALPSQEEPGRINCPALPRDADRPTDDADHGRL
jgi:hypothetical protein